MGQTYDMQLRSPDGHDLVIDRKRENSHISVRIDEVGVDDEGRRNLLYNDEWIGHYQRKANSWSERGELTIYQRGADSRKISIKLTNEEHRVLEKALARLADEDERFDEAEVATVK